MSDPNQFREIKSASPRRRKGALRRAMRFNLAARLPPFISGPADAVRRLRRLRVAIVGDGSVGGRVALHAARAGVAAIWLVDPKKLKAESVLTHDVDPAQVGQLKALVMGRRCKAISPATRVHMFTGSVQDLPMDAFAEADIVIMATDNLAAELEVGRRCRQLGKTLVHAGLHGASLVVQVRTFGNTSEASPCPGCGMTLEERNQLAQQVRFPCDGSPDAAPTITVPPTMSVSSLCALAADLAFNQVLRHVLNLGVPVLDTMVEFCGYTNRTATVALKRDPGCPCDHRPFAVATMPEIAGKVSLADLAEAAGFSVRPGVETFAIEGCDWARLGECGCAAPQPLARFIPAGQPLAGRCPRCRAAIRVSPFFRQRAVSAWTLGKSMQTPLAALGVGAVRCVIADDGQRAVLFRARNPGARNPPPVQC